MRRRTKRTKAEIKAEIVGMIEQIRGEVCDSDGEEFARHWDGPWREVAESAASAGDVWFVDALYNFDMADKEGV